MAGVAVMTTSPAGLGFKGGCLGFLASVTWPPPKAPEAIFRPLPRLHEDRPSGHAIKGPYVKLEDSAADMSCF